MLTEHENKLLCEVDAGKPMGHLLRRFWMPLRAGERSSEVQVSCAVSCTQGLPKSAEGHLAARTARICSVEALSWAAATATN